MAAAHRLDDATRARRTRDVGWLELRVVIDELWPKRVLDFRIELALVSHRLQELGKRDVHRVVLTLGVELRLIGDPRARNLAAAEFCHQPLTCELAAKGILPRLPSQHDWLTAYQVR